MFNQVTNSSSRLNEKFIELMDKMSDIMLKNGELFRSRAYQKAQETIMSYPKNINSPLDLKGYPGIGETIMEKLKEYIETGTLKILEREKNNPINILAEVYGIGPKKAKELVKNGITTISQLRENEQMLNDVQKVGLRFYEDILKRIPRVEIEKYKKIFELLFTKVGNKESKYEIVGSYRRGADTSGDIDVIITSISSSVFKNFIDLLINEGIITNVLSRGSTKCLVMAKLKDENIYRRVDFLYTSLEEFPFAILYFTGSKIFNTVMRHQALTMGLTMNEHGIYILNPSDKKKGEKVDKIFTTEEDIFKYLNIEYKQPHERIDGRAIKIQTEKIQIQKTEKIENKLVIDIPEDNYPKIYPPSAPRKNKKTLKKKLNLEEKPKEKLVIIDESECESETIIKNFRKYGINILENLNENQLSSIIKDSNKAYFNNIPIMTDNEYDIIKEFIEKKYPNNNIITEIGSVVEINKVTLPYSMGSMDKIKPNTSSLNIWCKVYKGPYVLSCKLDGVSGLYTTEGSIAKLYTRGDGKVGQDISHLIPYLKLPKIKGLVIRGEIIIPKMVFDTKYKSKFANPRNMVAGIINHKTINENVNDIRFVAYEVIKPQKTPSEQLHILSKLDIEYVLYKSETVLTNEMLSHTLIEWRDKYEYEIDGVIVSNDLIYDRKLGNPEHAFAFKMVLSEQIAEAKVVDVIWTPSKDGYLKPRVQIEPIHLCGVRIEYATGFNASFINDNKIGVGAIIEIIRSGDVIPHIRKVVVPALEAKMPSVSYKWNNTNIDVLLEDINLDETVKEKNITCFFKGIGVEGLSSGNISRIIQCGFDTVSKIIKMSITDFLKIDGFKEKISTKLYNGIREKLEKASLVTIMSSSNIFGRGFNDKKIELIMNALPNILLSNDTNEVKIMNVSLIKGMATKTSETFIERIQSFKDFMNESGLNNKLLNQEGNEINIQTIDKSHILYNKSIVITGFREKELENSLKNVGAKISSSVSKNTFVVIVKNNIIEDNNKTIEAKKLGIIIMSECDFTKKYL